MTSLKTIGLPIAAIAICLTGAARGAPADRQLVRLAAGETVVLFGASYVASAATVAIVSLSSELVTVAVVEGALATGEVTARTGEALVAPLDGGRVQRFGFDARRLAATLPAGWAAQAGPGLDRIAATQRHQRFWGRIEPVRVNASAPVAPQLEAVRASYLGNATVATVRQAAGGDPQRLALLTARRFAAALAARDAATVADLIDPKPFTDTGADAGAWQAARTGFAATLTADPALVAAMAAAPAAVATDQTAFDTGGYRIRLVPRDRAMFVTSVEAR